jgi:hypothetical protein
MDWNLFVGREIYIDMNLDGLTDEKAALIRRLLKELADEKTVYNNDKIVLNNDRCKAVNYIMYM